MDIGQLSREFRVRKLGKDDLEQIYELSCGNTIFYEHHPPFVTRESIFEDMEALPPGKGDEDKFYIGFFDGDALVALMDLIQGFPKPDTAFIDLFMMHQDYQGKGVGSKIMGECIGYFRTLGFRAVQLGVDRGNPQSFAFWRKNGFAAISEETYIRMELAL